MTHPAIEFLRLLDPSPEARFSIEAYTDKKDKPKPDPLSKRFANCSHEQVITLLPELQVMNDEGAAIYIAVNEFDGQRKIDHDLDGASEEQLEELREILPPTIAVQSSSAEKQHWYWLLTEGEILDADSAKAINQTLVGLGADPAAVDVARLLRLPGFRHMKRFSKGEQNA